MSLSNDEIKQLQEHVKANQQKSSGTGPRITDEVMASPEEMWDRYGTALTSRSSYADVLHAPPTEDEDTPFRCHNTLNADVREVAQRETHREWCRDCRHITHNETR